MIASCGVMILWQSEFCVGLTLGHDLLKIVEPNCVFVRQLSEHSLASGVNLCNRYTIIVLPDWSAVYLEP